MKDNGSTDRYVDMIDMPHHVSKTHPQMPMSSRAAQFSPFAALTGYDKEIESARDKEIEAVLLSEHGEEFCEAP